MNEHKIWDKALKAGQEERHPVIVGHHVINVPELKDDREAIRKALRDSREKRGVRVRSLLP